MSAFASTMLRLVVAKRQRKPKIVKLDAHNFIIRHSREYECMYFLTSKQRVKPVILLLFLSLVEKFSIFFFFYSAKRNSSSTKNHFALFYRLFISEPHRAKWNENLTLIKCNDWTAKDKPLKSSEKYQSESQRKRGHNGRIKYLVEFRRSNSVSEWTFTTRKQWVPFFVNKLHD